MSAGRSVRVLVVDDSAFARKVMRELLSKSPEIEIVGSARDGADALEKIAELSPDVVTLDLVMPVLDGVGVLQALDPATGPRVIVVSLAGEDTELGVAALAAGAFEIVHKPTALATIRLYELGRELIAKVIAAAASRARPASAGSPPPAPALSPRLAAPPTSRRVVLVGASTGGPQALTRLLRELPARFPVPIAIVLHIPPGYTEALARRLDGECALDVVEARDGLRLVPGMVALARAGMHLKLERDGSETRARLDVRPLDTPHRPSVDVLFTSGAECWGPATLGIVLTGMGDDGLAGARAIRAARGSVLTESERSCVIYGMPRSVVDAGLSDGEAPIDEMVAAILRHL